MVAAVSSSSINCLYSYSNSNDLTTDKSSNFSFQLGNDDLDILEQGGGDSPSSSAIEYSMSHCVNSFDDYKALKTQQILSETITINPTKVTSDNYSEYLKQKSEYKEKIASTDFEQGYKDFKSSSGCSSDEELRAIHGVGFTTMDGFKSMVTLKMYGPLGYIHDKDHNMLTADTTNNIIKGSKLSDLVDYFTYPPNGTFEDDIAQFKTLLSKVDPEKSGLGQDYLDNLSSALDSVLKEFEESHKQNGDASLEAINSSTSTSTSSSNTSDASDSSTTSNTLSFQDSYQRKIALQAYAS